MPRITSVLPAGDDHQVVETQGDKRLYRRTPCSDCPWRTDATGIFPAEAFRHSANTAYDMATKTFGCHQSGTHKPATCAGFLLRGADHNMSVRLGFMTGTFGQDIHADGLDLHEGYAEMAIANGVDPDDPVLTPIPRAR